MSILKEDEYNRLMKLSRAFGFKSLAKEDQDRLNKHFEAKKPEFNKILMENKEHIKDLHKLLKIDMGL